MKPKVSVEDALYFTKMSVRLACTWPSSFRGGTKWKIGKEDMIWCLAMLSALCLLFPLFVSIYKYRLDSIIVTQLLCFAISDINLIIKTIILRIYRKKSQILLGEMEDFLKNAKPNEIRVLQRYVDRFWVFHAVVITMNYLAAFAITIGPLMFPQPLPTLAVYPFSVESGIPYYLAYTHQALAGFQISSGLSVDCQVALMMWFAGARHEILSEEIGNVTMIEEFRLFAEKHNRLLSYATQVTETVRYVAFTTSSLCGFLAVMGSLQLVSSSTPLILKIQFLPGVLLSMINLLICIWPAENLIRVCELMGTSVYNTSWIDKAPQLAKYILIILQRSNRPVIVSIGGFLPVLSMRFYVSFLSAVFSYFTTLRLVVLSDGKE